LVIDLRSSGRSIVGIVEQQCVVRSVKDDMGAILMNEDGPRGRVTMSPGFQSSTFGRATDRASVDFRFPAPSPGSREVGIDADLAVLVGGEPGPVETPLRVAEGETFALGGVAFTVSAVRPSTRPNAAVEVRLRATNESVAKAMLDSLEVVGDNGDVRIVQRGWSTTHQPVRYTELTIHLAAQVGNVTLRAALPSGLEVVILPFQMRVGIGSVVRALRP